MGVGSVAADFYTVAGCGCIVLMAIGPIISRDWSWKSILLGCLMGGAFLSAGISHQLDFAIVGALLFVWWLRIRIPERLKAVSEGRSRDRRT